MLVMSNSCLWSSPHHSSGLRAMADARPTRGLVGVTFRFRENFPSYQTLLRHRSSLSTSKERTVNSQGKGRCHNRKTITGDTDLVRLSARSPTHQFCTVKTNSVCTAVDPRTFRQMLSLASAWPVLVRPNCRSKKFWGSDH
jgi:hypothetical protein